LRRRILVNFQVDPFRGGPYGDSIPRRPLHGQASPPPHKPRQPPGGAARTSQPRVESRSPAGPSRAAFSSPPATSSHWASEEKLLPPGRRHRSRVEATSPKLEIRDSNSKLLPPARRHRSRVAATSPNLENRDSRLKLLPPG